MVTLRKESSRQLGLKLGGRFTEPGIFVMEVLDGSVASQDGRLHPHDRILAINGADVRYARLDHASRLIQQSRHNVSLVVSRGPGANVVDSPGPPSEYQHLFRRPDPALPVHHWRTKSAPDRLVPRLDYQKDVNKSLGDVTDGHEDEIGSSVDDIGLSASCESLDGRVSVPPRDGSLLHSNGSLNTPGEPYSGSLHHSNGSLSTPGEPYSGSLHHSNGSLNTPGEPYSGSLGSLDGVNTHYQSNGSLGSIGSPLHQSSGSLSPAMRGGIIPLEKELGPPALPPRHRHALARTSSSDQLGPPADNTTSENLHESFPQEPQLDISGQSSGSVLSTGGGIGGQGAVDVPDGSTSSRMRGRRSRDSSDLSDLVHGLRKSLRIESAQLHQKTVTISKVSAASFFFFSLALHVIG